jgi:hypothetical protein
MVELKLSVALDEGAAARGLTASKGEFALERLMPGLYQLGVPTERFLVPFVVLTDHFDLSLLGFTGGPETAALLVHENDLGTLRSNGIELPVEAFSRRESLPGWMFRSFPWDDVTAIDHALRELIPAYRPASLPARLPLES